MEARKSRTEFSVKLLAGWFAAAVLLSTVCSVVVWLATISNFNTQSSLADIVYNTGLRAAAFEVRVAKTAHSTRLDAKRSAPSV